MWKGDSRINLHILASALGRCARRRWLRQVVFWRCCILLHTSTPLRLSTPRLVPPLTTCHPQYLQILHKPNQPLFLPARGGTSSLSPLVSLKVPLLFPRSLCQHLAYPILLLTLPFQAHNPLIVDHHHRLRDNQSLALDWSILQKLMMVSFRLTVGSILHGPASRLLLTRWDHIRISRFFPRIWGDLIVLAR